MNFKTRNIVTVCLVIYIFATSVVSHCIDSGTHNCMCPDEVKGGTYCGFQLLGRFTFINMIAFTDH